MYTSFLMKKKINKRIKAHLSLPHHFIYDTIRNWVHCRSLTVRLNICASIYSKTFSKIFLLTHTHYLPLSLFLSHSFSFHCTPSSGLFHVLNNDGIFYCIFSFSQKIFLSPTSKRYRHKCLCAYIYILHLI